MPSQAIDFQYQADLFSTPAMKAVFAEEKRFSRWLTIESALAAVQGELAIIPATAAKEICAKAGMENLDLKRVAAAYKTSRNSIMPVIGELKRICAPEAGEFVHYGLTTQDVLDTGAVLEFREAIAIIEADLVRLEGLLLALSRRHIETPMAGRSHGQVALPITFGFKTANWLAEIRRDLERLGEMKPRLLVGQIGGAVGSMAGLGDKAFRVAAMVMERLGLSWSGAAWHNSRDRMAECASFLAIVAGGCERIAGEIFELCRTEVGELAEPPAPGAASSSTMPHKRNPVISQRVCVLARQVRGLARTVTGAMAHQHERDGRCLWSEMLAMPEIFIYTGAALNYTVMIVDGIEVRTDRMLANLKKNSDAAMSEWLMFRLAGVFGKMRAREILGDIYRRATDTGIEELLRGDDDIAAVLKEEDYRHLRHPANNIGHCVEIARKIIGDEFF